MKLISQTNSLRSRYRKAIFEAQRAANKVTDTKAKAAIEHWIAHLKTKTWREIKELDRLKALKWINHGRPALDTMEYGENRSENSTATGKHGARSLADIASIATSNVASGLVEHVDITLESASEIVNMLAERHALANGSEASATVEIVSLASETQDDGAIGAALAEYAGFRVGDANLAAACKRLGCNLEYARSLVDELRARVPDFSQTRAHTTIEICDLIAEMGYTRYSAGEIEAYLRAEGVLSTGKEIQALRIIVAHLLSGYATVCVRALAIANSSGISARLGKKSPAIEAKKLAITRSLLCKIQMSFADDLGVKDQRFSRSAEAREICKKAQLAKHWRKKKALEALKKQSLKQSTEAK